jgi:hypothetical protein
MSDYEATREWALEAIAKLNAAVAAEEISEPEWHAG